MQGKMITDYTTLAQEVLHSMEYSIYGRKFNIITVDMEKTCDGMKCKFMKQVQRFGLCTKFINLVMNCIEDPTFAILANGSPTPHFQASMGVR